MSFELYYYYEAELLIEHSSVSQSDYMYRYDTQLQYTDIIYKDIQSNYFHMAWTIYKL